MYNWTESNGDYLSNSKKNLETYNWTESNGDYLNNSRKKTWRCTTGLNPTEITSIIRRKKLGDVQLY
jgi:hypothetical protein